MDLPGLAEKFTAAGGQFVTSPEVLAGKLEQCRAVVFDWDGVFNDGRKGHGAASSFAEADSMGTNMLRYGLWRRDGDLPLAAIISGANNLSANEFATREHFSAAYTGMRDKKPIIEHLCTSYALQPEQIACVFDDINDLPMAAVCGLRFRVRRAASPLFAAVADNGYCDYVSGANGNEFAVREFCELMLGLMGSYTEVVDSRLEFDERYRAYFAQRQSNATQLYGQDGDAIVQRDIT